MVCRLPLNKPDGNRYQPKYHYQRKCILRPADFASRPVRLETARRQVHFVTWSGLQGRERARQSKTKGKLEMNREISTITPRNIYSILAIALFVMVVVFAPNAAAQTGAAPAQARPKTAGETFKNITTSTLKGLPVDDFMATMGVMAAALGYDCENCHQHAGFDTVNWADDTLPTKVMARKMIEMVAVINRTNFGGAQFVTCWACHHGREVPATSIALDRLYDAPNDE